MRYVEHLKEIYESYWRGVIPASTISGPVNIPEKCAHVPGTRKGCQDNSQTLSTIYSRLDTLDTMRIVSHPMLSGAQ
jgi:hypothetical protein